jgi:hypothetical protein
MRAYGQTNAAPYASAPAVGAAGDTYWNTTSKILYVSDGTAWVAPSAAVGDGSITTAQLADAPNSVTTAKVSDLAITDAKIAAMAATKLTGTIAAARLPVAPSGIQTANVNDGAVTAAKLAPDANQTLVMRATVASQTAQSIPTGAWTALTFAYVVQNIGGMYSAASPDRLTFQQSGYYLVGAGLPFDDATGTGVRALRLSLSGFGNSLREVSVKGNPWAGFSLTQAQVFIAPDFLQAWAYQDSGAALNTRVPAPGPMLWAVRLA